MKLSKITSNLIGQPMFDLMAKANELERKGQRIIHFEIGDPNFNSPQKAIFAATQALNSGHTHYTNSMGIRELRKTIAETAVRDLGFKPSIDQILIAPANSIIDFTIRCVADYGDEIIMPDPGFPTYIAVASYAGMKPVGIPLKEENEFRMNPEDIRKAITRKSRLIIINSPNNPTGSVMTEEEVLKVAQIAEEKDIFLLSDEVYSKIVYSGKQSSPSIWDKCKERTIVLWSMSKAYAMSGWRIGYAIGPPKLIKKMGLLLETIISCLPAFTQKGAIAALQLCEDLVHERKTLLQKRRDALIKGLNSLSGVHCVIPQGAYYAFPNIQKTGMSSQEISDKMLNKGVCVLPANCFGKYGEGYIRLSYGSVSVPEIEEAIEKMRSALCE